MSKLKTSRRKKAFRSGPAQLMEAKAKSRLFGQIIRACFGVALFLYAEIGPQKKGEQYARCRHPRRTKLL